MIDREIEDAQGAVGGRVKAIVRNGDGVPQIIVDRLRLDGTRVRTVFTIMQDEEGNGPGALFTDEVES